MDHNAVAPEPREPTDSAELRKPHEMVVMVPRSNRVTLTGRRIYNALMHVSQARMAAMEAMPLADYMFEAPLQAILRTSGSSGEDRTAAKRYLQEMRGLEVDWESTAPGDGVKWRGFSMLSEVAIEIRNGENWVSWSYPPTIMAALREPKRWARLNLDVIASLGTYASVALYEICARYRDNPSGVTSRKPVSWWGDALSQGPGGSERREWRKFKNERVKPAIAEINAETDLEVELLEHKEGRAVMEAQFAVRRKRGAVKERQGQAPVDANLVLRAESLGIREIRLEGLIKEFGEALVRQKFELLEKRSANSALRSVDNAYSYLRSLLRTDDCADAAPAPAEPAVHAEPVSQEVAPEPARLTQTEVSAAWLNDRIAVLKTEVQALSVEQRMGLANDAISELTSKRMMNAVIARRVGQGDVLHGLLGSVVVRIYAVRRYGEGWDQPTSQPPADRVAANIG